jgi:hypothetical protein
VRSSEIKLALIDLAGPSVTGLLPIDGDLAWAGMAPDNASLVLVQRSAPPPKNTLEAPSKVLFIDVATGQVAATVPLSGVVARKYHVTLSPGGKYLYLLDATNGRLDIVSLERRAHAGAFQVGRAPRFVNDISRDRVLVLSAGPAAAPGASAPPGELRLLRDAEIASTVAVVARPFGAGVSESGDRLTVFGEGGITQLSWPALERNGETATSLSPQVLDVRVSSDGRRAFALDAQARVAVLDLASGRLVASVPTSAEQSSAKKWALFALGASVNTLVVVQGGQGLPLPLRAPWERDPPEPPATLALRPDGEAAYVFNPNTGTLTTIAAADGRVTGTLAITGRSATTLPGGRMLAIDDAKVLRLFDMTTNKTGGEVPLGSRSTSSDAITLTPLPGGNVVLATRGPSACFLDGATGAVLSQVSGLGRVADVVLER